MCIEWKSRLTLLFITIKNVESSIMVHNIGQHLCVL